MMKKVSVRKNGAFTLIELLVVVSIIVLLIAILIPSLANAKRQAKTVRCGANMRGIASAFMTYASEWNDAIAGSAVTSGRILFSEINSQSTSLNGDFTKINPPPVVQLNDWITPLSPALNLKYSFTYSGSFNSTVSNNYRKAMFDTQRRSKIMTCLSNEFLATGYSASSPIPDTGPMLSYSMGLLFLNAGGMVEDNTVNHKYIPARNGYQPKISRVGVTSQKVLIADGARFCTTSQTPDVSISPVQASTRSGESGLVGGAYADVGAWSRQSRAWDRGLAPGNININGGGFDARFYGFRHGNGSSRGAPNSFKMNLAFFDGHVELMGDLVAADPNLWCPSGEMIGQVSGAQSDMQVDVAAKYTKGQSVFTAQ